MKSALFIDDDEAYLYLIERMKQKGRLPNLSEMMTALNGREAIDFLLKRLEGDLPNAMFVDINMPVMDGHEFLEEFGHLREKHVVLKSVIPIAVVTTSTSQKDKDKVQEFGFVDEYLVKDVDINKLTARLNELLK